MDDTDVVCRYGGEEFAVLMPETSIDDAELRAEKCRLVLKSLKFSVPNLNVTASLGISALSENPSSPEDLFDQADKCLYVAKRSGRNQVVRWDKAQGQVAKLADEVAPTRDDKHADAVDPDAAIPFHAVAALTTD